MIYRAHGSDKTVGYDQQHVILCFAEVSIDLVGQSFGVSQPIEGDSAFSVLLEHLKR